MRPNPVLEKLTPYRAGPSLEDIRRRYQLERVSLLSANESPWGPFPEVVEAMKGALEGLNRYPDGACDEVRALLAERLQVGEDRFTFGNGSCELLMLLGEVFLGPGRHAVLPHPSFVLYRHIATARDCSFALVGLPGLEYDLEAMLAAITDETTLLVLCNPNNPTGSHVAEAELRAFLRRVPGDVAVILDEAYCEFVTPAKQVDSVRMLDEFPNLIILRTFSKIFGLAGLRMGYSIADPQVAQALDKVRQPFNVDSLAQVAAATSLRLPERIAERQRMVASERTRLEARLGEMGVLCHPSEANFVLVDVTRLGVPGTEVAQALLEKGVLTRSGYAMECPGWIRVTIGEAAENDMFLEALAAVRGSHEAPLSHEINDLSAEALSRRVDMDGTEMMIVMQETSSPEDVERIMERLESAGASGLVSTSDVVTVIAVMGEREVIAGLPLEAYAGVDKVVPILKPYKLVSREFRRSDTVITVNGTSLGGGHIALIAGPCSVESHDQVFEAARAAKAAGATMLRGGAYKPRTSPYAFQGLGIEGLQILAEAREATGLPVVTELMDPRHLEAVAEYSDVIQIGARNMQNFQLLSAVGEVDRPVLLKRGLAATIEELLMAAEYIVKEGNENVILCERGIRTFETATRNTLDLSAVPILKQRSHLPVVVDPSHATGKIELVEPLSLAAIAAGADGLMIEMHPTPEIALSDGAQSLNPQQFEKVAARIAEIVAWFGKQMG